MVTIIPRSEWNALEPKLVTGGLRQPVQNVFVMNTHSRPCFNKVVCMGTIRLLQQIHMAKQNQRDIRYNFMVSGDGIVYEGRGWTNVPLLPREHSRLNNKSILIGYIGDYSGLYVVPREEWSGLPSKASVEFMSPLKRPATCVYYQNTASHPCPNSTLCRGALRLIQQLYMTKYSNDVKFNFLIGGDGNVYEVRGWEVPPLLPRAFAKDSAFSLLIGFVGYYTEDNVPSVMLDAAQQLVDFGISAGQISSDHEPRSIMLSLQEMGVDQRRNTRSFQAEQQK